jgi:hypothetical protein
MLDQQSPAQRPQWQKADQVWEAFTRRHPELSLPSGRWGFHNFLRTHRQALIKADALRLARNRFWLGHMDRFARAAFECATGREPEPMASMAPVEKPRAIPRLPQASRFVVSQRVHCGGLSADEHLRLHGTLPTETVEKLLHSEESLLELADAVKEFLPALEWHSETIPATDLALLDRVKQALQAFSQSR